MVTEQPAPAEPQPEVTEQPAPAEPQPEVTAQPTPTAPQLESEQTKKLMLEVQAQLAELQAKYEAQQKARDEAEARSAETTTAPSEE